MLDPNNTQYPDIDVWSVVDLLTNIYTMDIRNKKIKFLISVANYGFTQGYLTELQKKYIHDIQNQYYEYIDKFLSAEGVEDDKKI